MPSLPLRPRSRRLRPAHGFTLIEVMVVLAIIGILTTVAMPQMQRFSLRAKRAERELIVRSIVRAVQQYRQADPRGITGMTLQQNPVLAATAGRADFNSKLVSGDSKTAGWDKLDFVPSAPLYLRYTGTATFPPEGGGSFTLLVDGDLDGDGLVSTARYDFTWLGEAWVQAGEPVLIGDDW